MQYGATVLINCESIRINLKRDSQFFCEDHKIANNFLILIFSPRLDTNKTVIVWKCKLKVDPEEHFVKHYPAKNGVVKKLEMCCFYHTLNDKLYLSRVQM